MDKSKENEQLAHMITPYSVSVYGGSLGPANVTEDALVALSYHVTYTLYEILKECKTEMNIYRQIRLSTTILSNVFQNLGFPNLHGNKTMIPYVSVPNTDMYVVRGSNIDLVTDSGNVKIGAELEPEPFIKGLYITPIEKINMNTFSNHVNSVKAEPKAEGDEPEDSTIDLFKANVIQTMNRVETDYFLIVSQIILSSENLMKIVLEDLRTNPRLGGVYYSLLNLIQNSVKYFKCIGKLVDRLLRTVEALLDNPFFDPSPSVSIDGAVQSLYMLMLDTKIANDCDDFPFRRRASYLLMRALNTWNVSAEERHELLDKLNKLLSSPEKLSLKLNYCTLMMFYGLGCENLDKHFWPSLNKYLNVLSSLDGIVSGKRSVIFTTDISHVKSALLLITEILFRNFWASDESIQAVHFLADKLLYEYFGESITPIRLFAVFRQGSVFVSSPRSQFRNDETVPEIRKSCRKVHSAAFRNMLSIQNKLEQSFHQFPDYNDVFDRTASHFSLRPIIFNFFGSIQLNKEHLKTKKCDQRYNVFCTRRPQKFLKYERMTRCIKYCQTDKSCAGDLFLII